MNKCKYINKDKKNKMPKDQVEVMSIFPTPVVVTNIGRDFMKDELQLFFEDILMMKNQGMTNHRSEDLYLFDSHVDTLRDIKKFIEFHLKQYVEHVEGANTNLAGLRITQSWLNKTKLGESHHSHFHLNSYLSGVFYIQCLPNDRINLINRSKGSYHNMEFSKEKVTEWNSNGAIVSVKKGDLILFSSWVPHHVDINETKETERISLSFNTFPIGEMGNYDFATQLKL